jgi:protein-disulfide isomerase
MLVSFGTDKARAWVQSQCSPISKENQSRLISYVASRYDIPATISLSVKSATPVSEDCHWKVVFAGQGPLGEVSLGLYLSPDARYLSKDLMDSKLDPVRERYDKARLAMREMDSGETPRSGEAHASVTLVVFSDFECPFCKKAAELVRSDSFVRKGSDVRVVFRHYPLAQHPWAQKAAEMAACAGFQSSDLFWQVHDSIFERQARISANNSDEELELLSKSIQGINQIKLSECIDRQLSLGVVLRDKALGDHLGVTATPTIFLNGETVQFSSASELHKLLSDQLMRQVIDAKASKAIALF